MGNQAALRVGQTANSAGSFSFWIKKPSNPAASQLIIGTGSTAMSPYVANTGLFRCDFDYPTAATTFGSTTPTTVTDNAWHHCVCSHSDVSDLSQIYLDNVQKLSTTKNDFLSSSADS